MENAATPKSVHEVYRIAKEQNLNDVETKALYKKYGFIVSTELIVSIGRQHQIAENILKRIKSTKK